MHLMSTQLFVHQGTAKAEFQTAEEGALGLFHATRGCP
jgi:hypothetical protein